MKCIPYLFIGLTAQPFHEDVGVEGVRGAVEKLVDGDRVGALN